MSTCRSCGAEVVFVPSAKSGKPMILDAKPEKRIVLTDGSGVVLPKAMSPLDVARVVDTYVDHHASCPQAEEWRR